MPTIEIMGGPQIQRPQWAIALVWAIMGRVANDNCP